MTETQILLTDIEAFLARHSMAASTFGNRACGDLHAVRRLRMGRGLTMRRAEQLRLFMSEYRPGVTTRPKRQPDEEAAA